METLTFMINDSHGRSVATDDISVVVNPVNDAPEFTSVPAESVLEDEVYSYTMTAVDVDVNDYFSFYITESPDWILFDGFFTISGTPDNEDVGDHNVTVTVDDGETAVDQSFTITVENTNDRPYFYLSSAPVGLYEDFTQIETVEIMDFYDPDDDVPVFSITPVSVTWAIVNIDPSSGTVTIESVPDLSLIHI